LTFLSKSKIFILNQILKTASEYLIPVDTEKMFHFNEIYYRNFIQYFQVNVLCLVAENPLIIS